MWERAQNLTVKRHGVRRDLDKESEDECAEGSSTQLRVQLIYMLKGRENVQ
jgi:hypothetical protein